MDNHYHLLLETLNANLAAGMRQLNGVYTQSFNHKHNRVGHLFQGRYQSILVEKEPFLLELCRYVVLNPVKENRVANPANYSWSSYKATAGLINPPPYLSLDWILRHFGKQKSTAQKKYKTFVREGLLQDSPWGCLKARCILGNEQFVADLKQPVSRTKNRSEIPKQQRLLNRPALEALFAFPENISKSKRNDLINKAILEYGYTQFELSKHLGLHYSTISRLFNAKIPK